MSPYSWFYYLEYVVTWNYTSSISLGIVSVNNVFYGVLIVKHFISDGLGKTKYSWRNLIFPWTFWQTICDVIFMNKLKSFIVKMNRYDIFCILVGFFCLCEFLSTFVKTISIMRSSQPFWKLLYCKFWTWRPNNFSSLFLKVSSNFRLSLLRVLRGNRFKKLKKLSMSDKRTWLVILDRILVSIKRSLLYILGKVSVCDYLHS